MSRWAARVIVALRFVLVPMWVGAAVLAVLHLPSLGEGQGGAIGTELLPADASALDAELLSKTQFGIAFVGRTVVVRHEPAGLPPGAVVQAVQTARDVRDGRFPDLRGLAAVIPVPDTALQPGPVPTTILYFLHFWPGTGGDESVEVAARAATRHQVAVTTSEGALQRSVSRMRHIRWFRWGALESLPWLLKAASRPS